MATEEEKVKKPTLDQSLRAMNAKRMGGSIPDMYQTPATQNSFTERLKNTIANSNTAQKVRKPAEEAVRALGEGRYTDAAGQFIRGVGGAALGLAEDASQPLWENVIEKPSKAIYQLGSVVFTGENSQPVVGSTPTVPAQKPASLYTPGTDLAVGGTLRIPGTNDKQFAEMSYAGPGTMPIAQPTVGNSVVTPQHGSELDRVAFGSLPKGAKLIGTSGGLFPSSTTAAATDNAGAVGAFAGGPNRLDEMAKDYESRGIKTTADLAASVNTIPAFEAPSKLDALKKDLIARMSQAPNSLEAKMDIVRARNTYKALEAPEKGPTEPVMKPEDIRKRREEMMARIEASPLFGDIPSVVTLDTITNLASTGITPEQAEAFMSKAAIEVTPPKDATASQRHEMIARRAMELRKAAAEQGAQ